VKPLIETETSVLSIGILLLKLMAAQPLFVAGARRVAAIGILAAILFVGIKNFLIGGAAYFLPQLDQLSYNHRPVTLNIDALLNNRKKNSICNLYVERNYLNIQI